MAADVDEALSKLREVNGRARSHQKGNPEEAKVWTKPIQNQQQQSLPFNGGRLIHRTEPDLKTHTSYLVFAVLPRSWSEEDEIAAQAKWVKHVDITSNVPKSQRQLKKEAKRRTKGQRGVKQQTNGQDRPSESVGDEQEET